MTADFGWRKFNFFDKSLVMDKEKTGEKFLGLKDVDADYWCSTGDAVYLGESKGGVFRMNNHLDMYYWKAYQVSLASLHSAGKYLFSIGEDDDEVNTLLKIWDSELVNEQGPSMKREVRLCPLLPISSARASNVAVHSSLSAIAVGFADGSVIFYQGDVLNDKALNNRWLKVRDPTPLEGPVTGLAIAFVPGGKTVLFVITSKNVFSYVIENKAVSRFKKHDASGASNNCWTFDESTGQLVVASREMVYFYEADQSVDVEGGEGRCLQLGKGNEKLQLVQADQHFALLTKQQALIQSDAEFMTMVTVYDVKGQFIGFLCSLPSLCRMFSIGNSLYILNKDGTLSELTEKCLNVKLDILFKKNLYDVAVGLARNSKDGSERLQSIHEKYADYLYGKGEFESAILQYKETIGMLEPSYVIKRYMDGTKLEQLCTYVECLHDSGKYNSHHTSILLNAYARRNEKKKLMAFVDRLSASPKHRSESMAEVFQILSDWGYLAEASLLATKCGLHELALETIVEHMKKYPMATKYISKRPTAEAVKHLEKHGRLLLTKCKEETMQLLIDLIGRSREENVDISNLLTLFLGDTEGTEMFVDSALSKSTGEVRSRLVKVAIEIRLRKFAANGNLHDKKFVDEKIIPLLDESNEKWALHTASVFTCYPLVEYLLEKTEKHSELMQHYMKLNDLKSIIRLCAQVNKSEYYIEALSYVAKAENNDEALVLELLDTLEKSRFVHPLVVLEVLSRSNSLMVSAVRDYVIRWISKQEEKIAADKHTISNNQKKMEAIDQHIDSMKFNVQVLQVNKCSACDTGLILPAVHFLCKHSFHVDCFEAYADRADRCPACTKNAKPEEQENLSDRQAYRRFQEELASCSNSMELIAKYLEKGLFDDAPRKNPKKLASGPSSSQSPFDEDDSIPASISRSMSNASSYKPSQRSDDLDEKNPFAEPRAAGRRTTTLTEESSKNPFGEPSTNPFGDF